jgi:hypothetical protein
MDIVAVWLIDIVFFPFLQDYVMHYYVSHTLSVTHYLFILFLVSRPGLVTLSVYRASHVCGNVYIVAALCSSWLESAERLRTEMRMFEYSWMIIDLSWGLLPRVCSLPKLPVLSLEVRALSLFEQHPNMFPTGPYQIQQWTSRRWLRVAICWFHHVLKLNPSNICFPALYNFFTLHPSNFTGSGGWC